MSEMIRQGRRLTDLGVALIEAIEAAGGSDCDAKELFKNKQKLQQIGQLVMGRLVLARLVGLPVAYDQALGLMNLIKRALGPGYDRNYNTDITPERYPLKGTDVRTVKLRVEPILDGETAKQAAEHLVAAGHILANTGDLVGYLYDHPKEVERWHFVVALSEDSRWATPGDNIAVPTTYVSGAIRQVGLAYLHQRFVSAGALVICE